MRPFIRLMIGALLGGLTVACTSPTSPTDQAEPTGMPSPSASAAPSLVDPPAAEDDRITTSSRRKAIGVRGNLAGRIGPTIDFGGIPLGTTKSALVQITSTGTEAITVTSVSVPAGYSVRFPSGPPLKIKPNQTQSVTITFAPKGRDTYSGDIVVKSDATSGTKTVAVSGTGVARVSFGAGTWIVGRDIQPGRYYTSARYSGANPNACSIASFNVLGQQIGGIGTLTGALQQVVDIPAFVYSVSSPAACGTWSMTPSYEGPIFGTFPEIHAGEWDVAHQIVPGTYVTPTACGWNRMRDFRSLGPSSTIASGVSTSVTVQAGDSGFLTHGCVWTLRH
jgi:hypothetical protein